MKKTVLTILSMFCWIVTFGQSAEEFVVRQFGNNLSNWCSSRDTDYRNRAQKQCADACRVKDKIMEDFVANSGLNIRDYVIPNYLNGFENALGKGSVNIAISNIRTVSTYEQSYSYHYGSSTIKQEQKRSRNFITVACDIDISGALNYHVKDLYYIRKGHIVKITPYEEVTDRSTGKKKVKVDFSDLEEEQTIGATYNYGKNWPIGLSVNYSTSMFMIGLDFGINTDKDKVYKHDLKMTDVMNYTKEDGEYDPLFFVTLTPSFYLKYFAIGCGAGFLYMNGTKNIYNAQSTSYDYGGGGVSISGSSSSSSNVEESNPKLKFMLRPTVKGFIPINDEWYISLSVGYDYAFGYKDKNGINFGVGVQFKID